MWREIHLEPKRGWPAAEGLFYQCMRCGATILSKPVDCTRCKCNNIRIDPDAGRLAADQEDAIKLFVEEGTERGPSKAVRSYLWRAWGLNPPKKSGYFWECMRCGDGVAVDLQQIHSCRCSNIIVDNYEVLHIRDKAAVRVFWVKDCSRT